MEYEVSSASLHCSGAIAHCPAWHYDRLETWRLATATGCERSMREPRPRANLRRICQIALTSLSGRHGHFACCEPSKCIFSDRFAIDKYSAQSQASAEYWKHFTARFDGAHAFGYNSAESEPIWMKA